MEAIDALEDGILNTESSPLLVSARVSKSNQVRQEGLQRIQKDMFTVNQLFKDLSNIVIQQSENIRSIDSSVEKSVVNSRNANEEISKTHKRYKDREALTIRIALFLLGFIVFVFLTRRILFQHW